MNKISDTSVTKLEVFQVIATIGSDLTSFESILAQLRPAEREFETSTAENPNIQIHV